MSGLATGWLALSLAVAPGSAPTASARMQGEWRVLGPESRLATALMAELALRDEAPDAEDFAALGLGELQASQVLAARALLSEHPESPEAVALEASLSPLVDASLRVGPEQLELRMGGGPRVLGLSPIADGAEAWQVLAVEPAGQQLLTFTLLAPDLARMEQAGQEDPMVLLRVR